MKKGENLVVFTLIAFVSFGLVLGYFFNTTSQDLTVKQVEDKSLENSNFIYEFFSSLFKNEEVMLSPGDVPAPTNKNVLCVYNVNSQLSTEICQYYLEKRPGARSLGLNVLDSEFVDQYKEVMNSDIFYQKIINPVLSYGEQNKEITHIAIAKDLPIVIIEGGQRYSAISYFFTPYRYIGTSPTYVGANATFNFSGDQFMSYTNRGVHFNASNYLNSSGGYTTRFVASHLTAYSLEDVKKMIDRSLGSPSPVSSWLIDKDPPVAGDPLQGGFSITDEDVRSLNQSLQERNISAIIINSDLSILQTPNPVIGYVGPGIYHTGYSSTYVTNPSLFNLQVSNRAIYSTIESYSAYTSSGSPDHIGMEDRVGYQSKIADAFSPNVFGGANYANSFSGAVGAVEEPGQAGIMISTSYLFRNYAQGLTLAESIYTNQRSPITLFGDPLMKINDIEELRLPVGGECNDNNSCLSGICEKDTFNVSRCQQLEISCLTPRNYDLLIEAEQTSKCLNYTNTVICSNRQFVPHQTCSVSQACSEKIVNGLKSASCLLINGELCSLDSQCNSNKCGLDLNGQKRCVNAGSCAIGEKRGEVSTGKFACVSDNQKRLCDNGIWTNTNSCAGLCSNGICEEERNWFIAPNKLRTKGGEFYSFYINVDNNNRSISNLFYNFSNGDSIFYFINGSYQGSSFFFGRFGNDFILKPYEGIIVRTSSDRNIILNGTAFNSAPPVELSSGFNLIGIGYCSANYTAKTAIEEIYAVSPNCSVITQPNSFGGPIEYWSVNDSYSQNGLKKDFKIYDYEPVFVKCNSNTSFTWRPSCSPPPPPDVISPIFISIPNNLSIDYGQSVSAVFSASDNKGSVSYSVNDTRFNISQNGLLTNKTALESGKYEIKITINDSSNNINITNYRIEVLDEPNPIVLLANGLRQNLTLTYGNTVNISVNLNGFTLLRNGVEVTNDAGKNIILNFGVYNFTVVKNQFVSALTVTVNKASQTIIFDSISDKKVGEEVVLSASSTSSLPVSFEVVSGENIIVPITGSFISGDNFEYNYFNVLLNIIKKFFVPQKEEVALAPVALVGNKINLTGAGSVTVKAMQSGNENYLPALDVERTFNIGKGIAQIQFSNLNQVYDGSAKSVGVSTIPSGLITTVTYNGASSAPVNAGSYNVVATINNVNYEGSSSAILIISKAEQTLTFNEISNKSVGEQFDLIASSTSGLSVIFENVSGPASLSGNRLTVTGPGTIVVRVKQLGDVNYNPAQSIDRTINSDCGSGFVRVVDECKAICTDFTYTPFGVCSFTGEQTRGVVSSIPAGCVNGLPSLNRSCTRICEPNSLQACDAIPNANVTGYKNKCDALGTNFTNENTCQLTNCNAGFILVGNECKAICTDFTYTPFGVCLANNTQVRAINSSIPNGCVGGNPILNQSCTYVPLFCEPNSIVTCDAVSNAEVTGYKNKCNVNGTAYLNESTCVAKKYVLNKNDLNVSVESGKKILRDSNNNIVIKIPSILDNSVLDDIDVKRSNGNESKEFVIVKNIDLLSGQTKSILLQRKNSNSNAVCIRDEPNLNNANDIKANCFKVRCPGNVGDYTCTLSGNTFEVSGLQNSGVIEDRLFCGDNLCSEGESCSSCATDCGSCSGANSGSNSNSGSGGGSNSNSGSGSNQQIIIDDSSSGRNNIQSNASGEDTKIELNRKIRSSQDNNNILNYVIGFMIFLAIVILIVLVSIFIRSPQRAYVPDANNSVFERKEY